ncbi:hypothetical protein OS493_006506 [Desmophyllum pertusum]|uniref:Uncharacterized protein n=1 Tax=Desmophyllum pertusum TaxID=174260 RepID=A0A9X0DAL8_9CNID|nr:hypothetical protein OS493_006506 [Desmophyllum pertusum]
MNALKSLLIISLVLTAVAAGRKRRSRMCTPYEIAMGCNPMNGRSLYKKHWRGVPETFEAQREQDTPSEDSDFATRNNMDDELEKRKNWVQVRRHEGLLRRRVPMSNEQDRLSRLCIVKLECRNFASLNIHPVNYSDIK